MRKQGWLPKWAPLSPGDLVDVVAPASSAPTERWQAGVEVLKNWGLQVRVPDGLLGDAPFFAHDDKSRWRHLKRALLARDSKAVWCLRGGVGSLRLADKLARLPKPAMAKPLIGFSDISVLLVIIDQRWSTNPIHGPVLTQLARGVLRPQDVRKMRALLFGELEADEQPNLHALNEAAHGATRIEGRLAGGNLCTLQTLCGGEDSFSGRGKIVFLEDTHERGYKLDRMLVALRRAGAFKGARAVIFGDFDGDQEPDGRRLGAVALRNFARELTVPVFKGLAVGHTKRLSPLVVGLKATLEKEHTRWRLHTLFSA